MLFAQMKVFAELAAGLSGIAAVPGMLIPPWKLQKRFKMERGFILARKTNHCCERKAGEATAGAPACRALFLLLPPGQVLRPAAVFGETRPKPPH